MLIELLILGVVIGSNNLATALSLGALGQRARKWRIVGIFGVFEFVVPLVGLLIGQHASRWFVDQAAWVSVSLLAGLGVWSIVTGMRYTPNIEVLTRRVASYGGLVTLALGLSIDNLIVGFSLGLRDAEPLVVATTITCFSMVFTYLGLMLGDEARRHWERPAMIGAGILLIALALASGMGWV